MTDAQAVALIVSQWYSRFFPAPMEEKEIKLHTATAWKLLNEAKAQGVEEQQNG